MIPLHCSWLHGFSWCFANQPLCANTGSQGTNIWAPANLWAEEGDASPGHGCEDHRKQKPPVVVWLVRGQGHQQSHQRAVVAVESRGDGWPGKEMSALHWNLVVSVGPFLGMNLDDSFTNSTKKCTAWVFSSHIATHAHKHTLDYSCCCRSKLCTLICG